MYFVDGDAGVTFAASGEERKLVPMLWRKLRTAYGPLSTLPRDAADLAAKVADAFGGECVLEIERSS
jgi:hypothetical protein